MKRLTVLLALALCGTCGAQTPPKTLLGTRSPAIDAAIKQQEDAVRAGMLDPQSAQFEQISVFKKLDGSYCVSGKVNARNAYGGYVGFRDFANGMVAPAFDPSGSNAAEDAAFASAFSACTSDGAPVYASY